MFKRFEPSNDCSTSTQVKASVQRGIKTAICESHPSISPEDLDEIIPKKPPLMQYKVSGQHHLTLYCLEDRPIAFQSRDGPILPSMKFVHMYPDLGWTTVAVDEGAIPYVLGGANIMCPGIAKDKLKENSLIDVGKGVIVTAEGKENAIAVGVMKMNTNAIKEINKGVGIEVHHFLGDGLYQVNDIS